MEIIIIIKKTPSLKASFKRFLGNGIISMKQKCDCLEEVSARTERGRAAPQTPSSFSLSYSSLCGRKLQGLG